MRALQLLMQFFHQRMADDSMAVRERTQRLPIDLFAALCVSRSRVELKMFPDFSIWRNHPLCHNQPD